MAEYIILSIFMLMLGFSIGYLFKAIKASHQKDLPYQANVQKLQAEISLVLHNLEELEVDFETQKLDEEDYQSLKIKLKEQLQTLKSDITNLEQSQEDQVMVNGKVLQEVDVHVLQCKSCHKKLEVDSQFCRFCGTKVDF